MAHEDFRITLETVDFIIDSNAYLRTFRIEAKGNTRQLCHIQYLGWPDHGVPTSFVEFENFLSTVSDKRGQTGDGSMIVHCRYMMHGIS